MPSRLPAGPRGDRIPSHGVNDLARMQRSDLHRERASSTRVEPLSVYGVAGTAARLRIVGVTEPLHSGIGSDVTSSLPSTMSKQTPCTGRGARPAAGANALARHGPGWFRRPGYLPELVVQRTDSYLTIWMSGASVCGSTAVRGAARLFPDDRPLRRAGLGLSDAASESGLPWELDRERTTVWASSN